MQRKTGLYAWLILLAAMLPLTQARAVQAVASHAVFYKPSAAGDSAVIEVYWQIDPLTLRYTHEGDKVHAAVVTSLRISPAGRDEAVVQEKYRLVNDAASAAEAGRRNLLEGKRYVLPQGRYNITLTLSDPKAPGADFSYTDSVQAITATHLYYSSLQMLDTAFENSAPSPFLKRGIQQFPSAAGLLEDGHPVLHIYYELYHTETLARSDFPLVQRTYITLKTSEAPFQELTLTDTIRAGVPVLPFLHTINTETLRSGNYYVRTSLRDKAGVLLAADKTFYQSINKNPKEVPAPVESVARPDTAAVPEEQVHALNIGKTFIAKYTPAQLRAILKMINPVATPDERLAIQNFLRKPDELYMRFFLYNFFAQRNVKAPDAAWKAFSDTVRQVNRQFSAGNTMGYETDRGAIYMRYGKPLERISMPNESGTLPYEIWTYNDIGGRHELSVFLFYQPSFAVGNLILLHSTLYNELHNPGWRSLLYTSGTVNENSRAEQYLGNR